MLYCVIHLCMQELRIHVLHDIQCSGACVIHKYKLGCAGNVKGTLCLAVQVVLVVIVEVALKNLCVIFEYVASRR